MKKECLYEASQRMASPPLYVAVLPGRSAPNFKEAHNAAARGLEDGTKKG